MSQTVQELESQFSNANVGFELEPSGLIKAVVESASVHGELYLHGAHVTKFKPKGQDDVLWMSQQSQFESGKPIRGGVPICFPWFGPHPSDPAAPAHGTARTALWQLTAVEACPSDGVSLLLESTLDAFQLVYRVTFADALELSLMVRLTAQSASTVCFEAALHTYLSVGNVEQVRIEGLEQSSFIDKVDDARVKSAATEPIQFTGECDRVYLDARGTCSLLDPVLNRRINVAKKNSQNTVIWNPWIGKSARMPDFGDSEWPSMVCIETANVGQAAVVLSGDDSHEMTTKIEVCRLD